MTDKTTKMYKIVNNVKIYKLKNVSLFIKFINFTTNTINLELYKKKYLFSY